MAETDVCTSCGAPGPPAGAVECAFCGASAPTMESAGPDPEAQEAVPPDLPAAKEARRIRGLAVPMVAGLVVVGIGYPLTVLAVTQIGRSTTPSEGAAASSPGAAPAPGRPAKGAPEGGRARLAGAVSYDGPITPLTCNQSMRLGTFQANAGRFSILVSVPTGSEAGTYPLDATKETFVTVTQLTTASQTWTSFAQTGSAGEVTVRANRSVMVEFRGLKASGGGAVGTIDGSAEVRCA